MEEFWKNLEKFFDRMIVPALLVLIVIVVADVFFTDYKYVYEQQFFYADLFVIFVFVGDLSFKFKHAKSTKKFFRHEWLEILAVIPFFWVFRLIESVARVGELVQEIVHLVTRGGRIARLFAALGLAGTRENRFKQFLNKIFRSDRFEKAASFFRHPDEK